MASEPVSGFSQSASGRKQRFSGGCNIATRRLSAGLNMFFGQPGKGGAAKGAKIPGLVEDFEMDCIDKQKTVEWMKGWAEGAVTDASLMRDEFVFPFEASPIVDGVSITFKYIEAGQIVPVGGIDVKVLMDSKEMKSSENGVETDIGRASIVVTRRDAARKEPYIGEEIVIGDMLRSLEVAAADGSIDPPSGSTNVAIDETPNEVARKAKENPKKKMSWKEATASGADTRFKAPWQVFLDGLKKTTNDRLEN